MATSSIHRITAAGVDFFEQRDPIGRRLGMDATVYGLDQIEEDILVDTEASCSNRKIQHFDTHRTASAVVGIAQGIRQCTVIYQCVLFCFTIQLCMSQWLLTVLAYMLRQHRGHKDYGERKDEDKEDEGHEDDDEV